MPSNSAGGTRCPCRHRSSRTTPSVDLGAMQKTNDEPYNDRDLRARSQLWPCHPRCAEYYRRPGGSVFSDSWCLSTGEKGQGLPRLEWAGSEVRAMAIVDKILVAATAMRPQPTSGPKYIIIGYVPILKNIYCLLVCLEYICSGKAAAVVDKGCGDRRSLSAEATERRRASRPCL